LGYAACIQRSRVTCWRPNWKLHITVAIKEIDNELAYKDPVINDGE